MSASSELQNEQQRLQAVLTQIQSDLSALAAKERALQREISDKKAVQKEVLALLSVAYTRSIVEERKRQLLSELAHRPNTERVELLIAALLSAVPRARARPAAPSPKVWRQIWPKLGLMDVLFNSPQPPADALVIDETIAIVRGAAGGEPSSVFVR